MYAVLVKGRKRTRIQTSGNVVITNYDHGQGDGFSGLPWRDTVDDAEAFANETVAGYLADGWTRVE